jgi:hypothetical protein
MSVIPLIFESVVVDGVKWSKVDSLLDYGQYSEVYTFNYTTGVITFGDNIHGKIPPNGVDIEIEFTPDTNVYGKQIAEGGWVSLKSSGVIQSEVTITSELAEKVDTTHVQVAHYPTITSVVGVWDNAGKTGTNYYTGGTFNPDTGSITLGSSLSGSTPYVEYTYLIKDDNESGYTGLTEGTLVLLANPIPPGNAKKLLLKVDPPSSTDPEGGVYLKVFLKVAYMY